MPPYRLTKDGTLIQINSQGLRLSDLDGIVNYSDIAGILGEVDIQQYKLTGRLGNWDLDVILDEVDPDKQLYESQPMRRLYEARVMHNFSDAEIAEHLMDLDGFIVDIDGTVADFTTNRTWTNAVGISVPWTNIPVWAAEQSDNDTRTPDISPIIQEIVNNADWESVNSMVIKLEGISGVR